MRDFVGIPQSLTPISVNAGDVIKMEFKGMLTFKERQK